MWIDHPNELGYYWRRPKIPSKYEKYPSIVKRWADGSFSQIGTELEFELSDFEGYEFLKIDYPEN